MTLTAAILILVSAAMHAGWNLCTKREHPSAAFFLAANAAAAALLAPVALRFGCAVPLFPIRVWGLIAVTGFSLACYYAALAGAYRNGDMSLAYPLARALPAVIVALITIARGQADQITLRAGAGIVLIVTGALVLPLRRMTELRLANYANSACILALLAALGTVGYSLADDAALRSLRTTPGMPLKTTQVTLLYTFFEAVAATIWLALFVAAGQGERRALRRILRERKAPAALTGAAIYGTYALILVAMAFVKNVSYVVAFRQLSILFGTVLGVFFLQEPRCPAKFVGVTVMFAGLVLVGTG